MWIWVEFHGFACVGDGREMDLKEIGRRMLEEVEEIDFSEVSVIWPTQGGSMEKTHGFDIVWFY